MRTPVLTQRERQVVCLVAQGLGNKEIAERLGISERASKGLVEIARAKLGALNRTQLATLALAMGLITPEELDLL